MKSVIKALIAGAVIAAIGVIILIAGLSVNGWKFENIKYTMQTFTAENENTALDIRLNTGSLRTEFYDGDRIVIEYPTAKRFETLVAEDEGKITFHGLHRSDWHIVNLGINNVPETVIKLPQNVLLDVSVLLDGGKVYLAGEGRFGNLKISMDAGVFQTENLVCETLICELDAGTVKIGSAECKTLKCELDAGIVKIDKLNCPSSVFDLDAGIVEAGFTGAQEEYTVYAELHAGRCNLTNHRGTPYKTIDVRLDAGTVKCKFGV